MKPGTGFLLSAVAALALPGVLAACGREAGVSENGAASLDAKMPVLAPAIIPPEEFANPEVPPSYEVAIATSAANHNNALKRCAQQPEAVRTQCEQEANAAYADAEANLQDLRGNQE